MDVCILCGGLGTRLKGVWEGPKCLIPVAGEPVLQHLLKQIAPLQPTRVSLALGHLAQDIMGWFFKNGAKLLPSGTVVYFAIEQPGGTAQAVRAALPALSHPLLILNGDTVPFYNLWLLQEAHSRVVSKDLTVAWFNRAQAGAYMFGTEAIKRLSSSDYKDLSAFIDNEINVQRAFTYTVPVGYLDVGTPGDFERAKKINEIKISPVS